MRTHTLVSTLKTKTCLSTTKFYIIANGVKWQVNISAERASISALQ